MADKDKQNNDQQEKSRINDDNISSLFEQIYEQLVCIIVFYSIEYPWKRKLPSIRCGDITFSFRLDDILERSFRK